MKILSQNWIQIQKPTLPKFEISIFKLFSKFGFQKNTKSAHQNLGKCKIGTSKPEIRFRFCILVPENLFLKLENRFLQFLSNIISRPQSPNSAMSKTLKSTLFFASKFKFFFGQNLDFALNEVSAGFWTSWQPQVQR